MFTGKINSYRCLPLYSTAPIACMEQKPNELQEWPKARFILFVADFIHWWGKFIDFFGLRPSTLHLSHGGSPTIRVDGEEPFLFLANRRDRETNPELQRERPYNHYPWPCPEIRYSLASTIICELFSKRCPKNLCVTLIRIRFLCTKLKFIISN